MVVRQCRQIGKSLLQASLRGGNPSFFRVHGGSSLVDLIRTLTPKNHSR